MAFLFGDNAGGGGGMGFYYVASIAGVFMFLCSIAIILFLVYRSGGSGNGGGGGGEAEVPGTSSSSGSSSSSSSSPQGFPPIAGTCPDKWKFNDIKASEGQTARKECALYVAQNANKDKIINGGTLADTTGTVSETMIKEAQDLVPSLKFQNDTITFNPDDPNFSHAQPAVCGRKLFSQTFDIGWEGVSNYNHCEQ